MALIKCKECGAKSGDVMGLESQDKAYIEKVRSAVVAAISA